MEIKYQLDNNRIEVAEEAAAKGRSVPTLNAAAARWLYGRCSMVIRIWFYFLTFIRVYHCKINENKFFEAVKIKQQSRLFEINLMEKIISLHFPFKLGHVVD